jgi:hypothetical protein
LFIICCLQIGDWDSSISSCFGTNEVQEQSFTSSFFWRCWSITTLHSFKQFWWDVVLLIRLQSEWRIKQTLETKRERERDRDRQTQRYSNQLFFKVNLEYSKQLINCSIHFEERDTSIFLFCCAYELLDFQKLGDFSILKFQTHNQNALWKDVFISIFIAFGISLLCIYNDISSVSGSPMRNVFDPPNQTHTYQMMRNRSKKTQYKVPSNVWTCLCQHTR